MVPGPSAWLGSSSAVTESVLVAVKGPLGALVEQHIWMRGTLARSSVPSVRVTPGHRVCTGQTGKKPKNRDNPQLTWLPAPLMLGGIAGRFNAR